MEIRGLEIEEARLKLAQVGPNRLPESKPKSAWLILIDQFSDWLIVILLAAAVIAGFMADIMDTIVIVAIVILNISLGFFQEYKAARAIDALKALSAPQARVKRSGRIFQIPATELVPGDLVLIEAGDIVPADIKLIESTFLETDESILTGESQPILKTQEDMIFKGSSIPKGKGIGVVIKTGEDTELGRIASLLKNEAGVKAPLQIRIADFSKNLSFLVLILCVIVFGVGLLQGVEPILMFMTALSLAVAAIPEALPAVITMSLALGARAMSRKNALVRKLSAVESLGSVTCICADKTGTLTKNKMSAEAFFEGKERADFFRAMALNNDVIFSPDHTPEGDPTEIALLMGAFNKGFDKETLEKEWLRVAELPFSSERGLMTTVHQHEREYAVCSKGAPEKIMPLCLGDEQERATWRSHADSMAKKGFRVLAFAGRGIEGDFAKVELGTLEKKMTFLGLVGLIDPPRPEALEAIRTCKQAGIRPIMMTGDHPLTAHAIALQLEILDSAHMEVMTGAELNALSKEELEERIEHISVYARVLPEQKIRLVKALQARGEIVAVTGDGVNDGPALKRADIGVAMGKGGTEVAREAASMILLDDNFATIVSAVKEGRRIYDNIRKFVRFALSGNSGEMWTLFLAPFLGLPIPLLPIHILWVNLVTDGLPGLALVFEPGERNLMRRGPRPPKENFFARGLWQHSVWVGVLTAGATLGVMSWAYHSGVAHWQSMAFTVLTLVQMGHVLAIRSENESIFTLGFWSNWQLLGAVGITFVLQMALLYLPVCNRLFKTAPLHFGELLLCLAASMVVFIAVELEKWLRRYQWFRT